MICSKKLLSIFVACSLTFASMACECANAIGSVSDNDTHVHHQLHDDTDNADNLICPHQACEDCKLLEVAATPERDVSSASIAKPTLDDDVVWIETTAFDIRKTPILLARAGPPSQRPSWRAETPVRRSDLLLE